MFENYVGISHHLYLRIIHLAQILEKFDFQMNRAFVSNMSFYQCIRTIFNV